MPGAGPEPERPAAHCAIVDMSEQPELPPHLATAVREHRCQLI